MDAWEQFIKMVNDVWESKPLRYLLILVTFIVIALLCVILYAVKEAAEFTIANIEYFVGFGGLAGVVVFVVVLVRNHSGNKPRTPRPPNTYGSARTFSVQTPPSLKKQKSGGLFSGWFSGKKKTTSPTHPQRRMQPPKR